MPKQIDLKVTVTYNDSITSPKRNRNKIIENIDQNLAHQGFVKLNFMLLKDGSHEMWYGDIRKEDKNAKAD